MMISNMNNAVVDIGDLVEKLGMKRPWWNCMLARPEFEKFTHWTKKEGKSKPCLCWENTDEFWDELQKFIRKKISYARANSKGSLIQVYKGIVEIRKELQDDNITG